ncbi:hypothetical protein LPJ75_005662, partial [Coemansia sp. RSA 2598]
MDRVRSTLKAVVSTGASLQSPTQSPGEGDGTELASDNGSDNSDSSSDHSSCSDDEISDVLDETEIQLIEAMEDSQVPSALEAKSGKSATAADIPTTTTLHPPQLSKVAASSGTSILSTSPRKGLSWVGLGENAGASRASYTDSLKVRFSSPQKLANASIRVSSGDVMSSDSDSFSDDSDDSRESKNNAENAA